MADKNYLLTRVTQVIDSGTFGIVKDEYNFGADFQILNGTPVATAVIEYTTDGGFNWLPIITFNLDTTGTVGMPVNDWIQLPNAVGRARVTSLTGGAAAVSIWMI